MNLTDKILSDLTTAMKAKDAKRLSVLRMVKANLMNKRIEKGADLADEEVVKALQTLVKQRRDSADQYQKADRPELAENELAEIEFIEEYLPRSATDAEIERAVDDAIAESGASTMREMGAVMKLALGQLAGKTVDGKAVSEAVKNKLQ